MASLNQVELIGRLGDDPELRDANGTPVVNLSIATDESYTRDDGTEVPNTEWHDVTVFGRQAETTAQYTSKGSQVYVRGRLQTSEYTDRDGIERYSTEVIAQRVLFLDGGDNGGDTGGRSQQMQRQDPSQGTPQAQGSNGQQSGGETFEPDDELPF
jgi:single-strand DNA-binding protein